ncbi:MAG: shikimate kinase [Chitinophagaceae bacterium]|nr:shikimate kinase [Chitinophagaceae bacterium]
MRFFLTGFMGSGKSFWQKKLSIHLPFPCLDLDEMIVQGEQQSITRLFEIHGESGFRVIERQYLQKTIELHDHLLLSLGGGTAVSDDTIKYLRSNGVLIYLQCPVDLLVKRLLAEKEYRPLLRELGDSEIEYFARELFLKREKYYMQSDHIIDAEHMDTFTFAQLILNHV